MSNRSRRLKVLIDAISNLSIRFGTNILSFITLPLYIKVFGKVEYGVFLLAYGLIESLVFFDFGIGSALVKYTALYNGHNFETKDELNYAFFINWTVRIALVLAIIFSLITLTIGFNIEMFFKVGQDHNSLARNIFTVFALYVLFYGVLRQAQYYLEGLEEFVFLNKTKLILVFLLFVLYLMVLFFPIGIIEFVILFAISNLVPYCIYFLRLIKSGLIDLRSWSSASFFEKPKEEYLKFSLNMFYVQLTSFFFTLFDKFIIGAMLGPVQLVYYNAVTKLSFIVRMINNQSLLVLNPMIAKISKENLSNTESIIEKVSLIQFIVILPIVAGVSILIYPFIDLWLGKDFLPYTHWGIFALLIYVIGPFSGMIQRVLKFGGFDHLLVKVNIFLVLINLFFSILLTNFVGIGGPILGSLIQVFLSVLTFQYLGRKLLGVKGGRFDTHLLISSFIALLVCLLGFKWLQLFPIVSWLNLIFFALVLTIPLSLHPAYILFFHPRYRVVNLFRL